MATRRGDQYVVGLALATSANGTDRNGASVIGNFFSPCTFTAYCEARVTTSSVLATFVLQASQDGGTTWYDLPVTRTTTGFATAAGTGVEVITTVILTTTASVGLFRVKATLSGAATAAADKTKVDYAYVQYGLNVG